MSLWKDDILRQWILRNPASIYVVSHLSYDLAPSSAALEYEAVCRGNVQSQNFCGWDHWVVCEVVDW